MNGKKAKTIRKIARGSGNYSESANYITVQIGSRVRYSYNNKTKMLESTNIPLYRIENKSKIEYRRMKRAYLNRELGI